MLCLERGLRASQDIRCLQMCNVFYDRIRCGNVIITLMFYLHVTHSLKRRLSVAGAMLHHDD